MAAVDEEFDGVDETAVVGREEDYCFGDFVESANSAERNVWDGTRDEIFDLLIVETQSVLVCRRRNNSGADDIDANFSVFEIDGPTAREGANCRFCGAVDAECRHSFHRDNRSVKNDIAAVFEQQKRFLYREEKAFHVYVEGLIEMFFGDGAERPKFAEASSSEDDVEMAFFFFHNCVEAVEVGKIGDGR